MMRRVLRDKRLLIALSLLIGAGLLASGGIILQFRKANAALSDAKQAATRKEPLNVQVRDFSIAPNPQATLIRSPYEVRDIANFAGEVYAATSNGLVVFDASGREIAHWTPLQGLPSTDLTSLAVLKEALWIGTQDSGLIRYSNKQWTHYLPADAGQRSTHTLLATSQGTLLAGTSAGILILDGDKLTKFLPALSKQKITSLSGNNHNLCIGTFDQGLYVYEAAVLTQYSIAEGIQDRYVTQTEATEDGCYVATPSGLQLLQDKNFRMIAKNLFVTSFAIETPILWVATRDRGVIQFNTQRSAASLARTSTLQRRSPTLIKKVDSNVMASTSNQLSLLDGKEWKTCNNTASPLLTDLNVSTLLHARNGELWIGYFDRGLDILSAGRDAVTHLSDETLFCINHISEDRTGRVYVSTSNGLVIFQPDRSRKIYKTDEGLLSDRVMQALPLDPDGKQVAIATTQGFTLKEGESLRSIYAFHGLVNNHIYSMAADSGQIYLGTLGGISRVQKMQVTGSWTQMDSGLKRNWVNALMSVDNKLFVGTYGSGIQIKTENGEWKDFPSLPEDLEINPNAVYSNGRDLFFGTLDRGFYVYDTNNGSWKNITHGLPSLNVTSFAADGDSLFVGTDRGLLQMKYDKISTTADIF